MDMVRRGIGLLLLLIALTARDAAASANVESALDRWQPLIDEAAHRFAIPAPWIRAVMRLESAGHAFFDGKPITSSAGAMGLMQVMPATYAELRERYALGTDPYDPHDNIFAGAAYLSELYERYGWPSLFAAYHAGPARFETYLSTNNPLPKQTCEYLAALVSEQATHNRSTSSRALVTELFVPLSHAIRVVESDLIPSPADRLFVRLRDAERAPGERLVGFGYVATEVSDARDP